MLGLCCTVSNPRISIYFREISLCHHVLDCSDHDNVRDDTKEDRYEGVLVVSAFMYQLLCPGKFVRWSCWEEMNKKSSLGNVGGGRDCAQKVVNWIISAYTYVFYNDNGWWPVGTLLMEDRSWTGQRIIGLGVGFQFLRREDSFNPMEIILLVVGGGGGGCKISISKKNKFSSI